MNSLIIICVHRENTIGAANMNSRYFKLVILFKKFPWETVIKFTGLPFISASCTVDSRTCSDKESNIHVKSCKVHMKSSRKFNKRSY